MAPHEWSACSLDCERIRVGVSRHRLIGVGDAHERLGLAMGYKFDGLSMAGGVTEQARPAM
jgi:hypothetical protein